MITPLAPPPQPERTAMQKMAVKSDASRSARETELCEFNFKVVPTAGNTKVKVLESLHSR